MTAQTLTLTQFLLDRIREDEAAARAASEDFVGWMNLPDNEDPVGVHIQAWIPARVLAECAAKRTIVDAHPLITDPKRLVPVWAGSTPGVACETCGGSPVASDSLIEDIGPCDTLCALASVYADHPLYRSEWKL